MISCLTPLFSSKFWSYLISWCLMVAQHNIPVFQPCIQNSCLVLWNQACFCPEIRCWPCNISLPIQCSGHPKEQAGSGVSSPPEGYLVKVLCSVNDSLGPRRRGICREKARATCALSNSLNLMQVCLLDAKKMKASCYQQSPSHLMFPHIVAWTWCYYPVFLKIWKPRLRDLKKLAHSCPAN